MEWISVEDRLPEEQPYRFEFVLVAKVNGVVDQSMFNTKTKDFCNIGMRKLTKEVTHWMPLPSPPIN